MKRTDLTIIIPSHKRHKSLKKCVLSLLNQKKEPFDLNVEIKVVTNFFEKKTFKWVESLENKSVTYDYVGRLGVNAARNRGVQGAQGAIIGFLDDDCWVKNSNFFIEVLGAFQKNLLAAAIGGRYLLPKWYGPSTLSYFIKTDLWLSRNENNESGTSAVVGGNVFYRREILLGPNRFDENIVYGSSETEFNLRLQRQGRQFFYNKDLAVIHDCQINFFSLVKKSFKQGQGWAKCKEEGLEREAGDQDKNLSERKFFFAWMVLVPIILYMSRASYFAGYRYELKVKKVPWWKRSKLFGVLSEVIKDVFEISQLIFLRTRTAVVFWFHWLMYPLYKTFWFVEFQICKIRWFRERSRKLINHDRFLDRGKKVK